MGFGIAGLWDALPRNYLTPWTVTCGILLIVLLIVAVLRMANENRKEVEGPDVAAPPG
jgi:ABC-type antimicrobial peptide transport system permease subunit